MSVTQEFIDQQVLARNITKISENSYRVNKPGIFLPSIMPASAPIYETKFIDPTAINVLLRDGIICVTNAQANAIVEFANENKHEFRKIYDASKSTASFDPALIRGIVSGKDGREVIYSGPSKPDIFVDPQGILKSQFDKMYRLAKSTFSEICKELKINEDDFFLGKDPVKNNDEIRTTLTVAHYDQPMSKVNRHCDFGLISVAYASDFGFGAESNEKTVFGEPGKVYIHTATWFSHYLHLKGIKSNPLWHWGENFVTTKIGGKDVTFHWERTFWGLFFEPHNNCVLPNIKMSRETNGIKEESLLQGRIKYGDFCGKSFGYVNRDPVYEKMAEKH